jgi:predicted ATP-grasp superfamily ATP-dependent carboligase
MPSAPNLPEHVFDRIPVVLLGGVNLVRALGTGRNSRDRRDREGRRARPGVAPLHARCVIPSPAQGDAAVDALVSIGDRLVTLYGRRAPLFYGSDEWLTLIYSHRERLERYFLLLLNDPQVADAMLTKDGFQAFARRRGLPVPAALRWEGDGPASVASYPGPVVVKPSNKDGWTDSLLRKRAFGRAKALVFPSGADANDDIVLAHFRDQLTVQQYVSGDDRSNWSFHGFSTRRAM